MKAIKLFLAITVSILLISVYLAYAEEEREKVIIRLPEFIIFSEEHLQEAPAAKPEKAAPFKDIKGLKDDVHAPDSETTPNAEAKEKLKKKTPSQMSTGWVYGNSVALFLVRITGEEPADEALFKSGLYFYKNEEYKKAIDAFKKLIKKHPKSNFVPASAYWIAEAYYAMGSLNDAIDAYEDTIKKYPESDYWDYAHYSLGWLYVNKGDYKKAIHYFTMATKAPINSLAYSAQFWVGDCLMRLKQYEDAINIFHTLTYSDVTSKHLNEKSFFEGIEKFVNGRENYREFISRFPFPQSLLINTAMYGLGVYGKGLEKEGISFQRANIKGIKNVVWGISINTDMRYLEAAIYRTALAYIGLNKMEKAREEARRLKNINPMTIFSDYIEMEVGIHYYKNKNKEAALKIFQFIAKNTLQKELAPIAEFMIGEILYKEAKLTDALDSYERAEKNPERPQLSQLASYKSGIILYQRKDYKKVLEKLQPLKNKPALVRYRDDINYLIAESLTALGEYNEAISYYHAIPNTSPLSEKVQYGRGWVYYKKGQWKEAAEAFNIFLEKYPQSPLREDALFRVADSYLNLKDFRAYYNAYGQFLKEYPKSGLNKEIALQAGLAMYRDEKFEDAAAVFKNIASTAPKSEEAEEASFRLGWTYFRTNDYKKAISEFNSHISNYPKSQFIAEALLKTGDSYYNLKEYSKELKQKGL
ncbi:MAG: tetratricopeptide repeat protein [Nitrospirae bacterium]|nr:tetratricopeptide repeat protein [Nitrospirota bacterium]